MLCIKREENSVKHVTSVSGVILRVKQSSEQSPHILLIFAVLRKSKLQKRSNLHDTRGITPKHATSGEAHLCACATQFRIPKKKKTSQRWRAYPANSDVFNHYAKRLVQGKFKFEFLHVLRIIKATKIRMVSFVVTLPQNYCKKSILR